MKLKSKHVLLHIIMCVTIFSCTQREKITQADSGDTTNRVDIQVDTVVLPRADAIPLPEEVYIATCECEKENTLFHLRASEDYFIEYDLGYKKLSFILMNTTVSDIPTAHTKRFLERIAFKNDDQDSVVLIIESGQGMMPTLLSISGYINGENIKIDTCDSYKQNPYEKSSNLHDTFYDVIGNFRGN